MTRALKTLLALLLTSGATVAQQAENLPAVAVEIEQTDPPATPELSDLLWIARPLVVFADTPNDPRFAQQMRMLDERMGELLDREVVILTDTDPAAAGPLRRDLRPRGFGLVLIDIDGKIASRRPSPTPAREIINLIDRMPSRREETGSRRP